MVAGAKRISKVLNSLSRVLSCREFEELRQVVLWKQYVGRIADDLAALHVAFYNGIFVAERTVGEGGVNAVVVLVGRALAVLRAVHEAVDADSELVLHYYTVNRKGPTISWTFSARTNTGADLVGVAELGLSHAVVDESSGRAQSE